MRIIKWFTAEPLTSTQHKQIKSQSPKDTRNKYKELGRTAFKRLYFRFRGYEENKENGKKTK